mgnify:FL=1
MLLITKGKNYNCIEISDDFDTNVFQASDISRPENSKYVPIKNTITRWGSTFVVDRYSYLIMFSPPDNHFFIRVASKEAVVFWKYFMWSDIGDGEIIQWPGNY